MADKEGKEGKEGKEKSKRALDLDLTNSSRDVWLVKVPKYISDRYSRYYTVSKLYLFCIH